MTVEAYAGQWLEGHVKEATKYRTYERYESALPCHVLPTLGRVPLSRVTNERIESLLQAK